MGTCISGQRSRAFRDNPSVRFRPIADISRAVPTCPSMKWKLVPLVVLPSLLLGGCYVRVPIADAVATPVTEKEAAALGGQGERPPIAGKWFQVRLTIPRNAVRKIARWQIYTHIRVEDCRTGDLVGIVSSVGIEGTDGDFERMERQLRANKQRDTFVIAEPILIRAGRQLNGLCVHLEGGSYTLQKISRSPVPLRVQPRDG